MKKINWTPEQEAEINRIQRTSGVTRKSAIRKMRAAAKGQRKGSGGQDYSQAATTTKVCRRESLRGYSALQSSRTPYQGPVHRRLRRTWANDDVGSASRCWCACGEVPSRALPSRIRAMPSCGLPRLRFAEPIFTF